MSRQAGKGQGRHATRPTRPTPQTILPSAIRLFELFFGLSCINLIFVRGLFHQVSKGLTANERGKTMLSAQEIILSLQNLVEGNLITCELCGSSDSEFVAITTYDNGLFGFTCKYCA